MAPGDNGAGVGEWSEWHVAIVVQVWGIRRNQWNPEAER